MSDTENQLKRRKQMIYRANHRGIKEMDIILGDFATQNLLRLSSGLLDEFEALSEQSDRDLLSWFTGEKPTPAEFDTEIFAQILNFAMVQKAQRNGREQG